MANFLVLNGIGINGAGIRFDSLSQITASGGGPLEDHTGLTGFYFNNTAILDLLGENLTTKSGNYFGTLTSLTYSMPAIAPIFRITEMNVPLADVAPVFITGGGDELAILASLFSGDDTIGGSTQADFLMGFAGADTINAGDGNDTLDGGAGVDALNGGAGFDTADYTRSLAGVTADLTLAGPQVSGGDANGDTLSSIEHLVGSAFADALTGSLLYGHGGADLLIGTDGNDNLCGGEGADVINGGDGFDLARYDFAASSVTVDLAEHGGFAGEANGDSFDGIEGVVGSAQVDILLGDVADNHLYGAGGRDQIHGRGGADILVGGDGADHLEGGIGVDFLVGGDGADEFITTTADIVENEFDFVLDFSDGDDSIVLSGGDPQSYVTFEIVGHVFIASSTVGYTGGIVVLNATLAQVQDQIVIV